MKRALVAGVILAVLAAAVAYAAGGGVITLNGATSGTVTVQVPSVAGSTTFQLPGSNGTSGYVLSTDGTGVTSWISNAGTASTALSSITAAAAAHTVANLNFAQTWTWNTLTTQTAMTLSSSSLTNGSILSIQNSAASATSTGKVLSISDTTTGAGYGVYSVMSATANSGYAGYFTNTGSANTGYAGYFSNTDTSSDANYGVTGIVNSTNYYSVGVYGIANSTTGQATGVWGVTNSTGLSAATAGTANATTGTAIGVYGSSASTGASMGVYGNMSASSNTGYAGYFTNTGTGANYGVYASTSSTTGYAGYFNGLAKINGSGAGNINLFINGRIQTGDGSYSGGMWVDSANSMFMGAYSSNVMGFYNNGWTGLVQTSTGSVGIGTTSPAYTLDVLSTSTNIAHFAGSHSTSCTLSTGGVIACSSDARLKKDVMTMTNALDDVMRLRPVAFRWNTEEESMALKHGFIAQEVETVMPDLVGMDKGSGYKTLSMVEMVPYLVGAIKDLKAVNGATIKQQQAEIVALQRELDALKTQNQAMHADFATYKQAHP